MLHSLYFHVMQASSGSRIVEENNTDVTRMYFHLPYDLLNGTLLCNAKHPLAGEFRLNISIGALRGISSMAVVPAIGGRGNFPLPET